MKRFMSMLLALAMVLCLAAPAATAASAEPLVTATLTADKETVNKGEDVTLTLSVDKAVTHLTAWQFNVYFDSSRFTFKSGAPAAGAYSTTTVGLAGDKGEGMHVPVSAISPLGLAVDLNAGDVCTFTFTANEDAAVGDAEFRLVCIDLYDYDDYSTNMDTQCVVNSATVSIAAVYYRVHITGNAASDVYCSQAGVQAGDDVTFTVLEDGICKFEVSVTVGGEEVTPTRNSDGDYVVSNVTGKVVITVVKSFPVTLEGNATEALTLPSEHLYADKENIITVTKQVGYDYRFTFKCGETILDIQENDGKFVIPADTLLGPLTITAEKIVHVPDHPYSIETKVGSTNVEVGDEVRVRLYAKSNDAAVTTYNGVLLHFRVDEGMTVQEVTFPFESSEAYVDFGDDGDGLYYIELLGYEKQAGTDDFAEIVLKATAAGTAALTIEDAYVSNEENIGEDDVYAVNAIAAPVTVTITEAAPATYTVTVAGNAASEVTAASAATEGQDFTFTIAQAVGFDYAVTAVAGEKAVAVTGGNGSYAISGSDITGNLTITVTRTPIVTLGASLKNAPAEIKPGDEFTVEIGMRSESSAKCQSVAAEYTFDSDKLEYVSATVFRGGPCTVGEGTLRVETGGGIGVASQLLATITFRAKAAGEAVITPKSLTLNGSALAVIIPSGVTITITEPAAAYTVSVTGTGAADVVADTTATEGQDFTFTVAEQEGFTYTVTATVGGAEVTVTGGNGSYTISGADITGSITITVNKENADPIATGYGVYVDPESQDAIVDEQVEVKVKVSSNEYTTFNAYMAEISYDTDLLTLDGVTFLDDNANYSENGGMITLVGFGQDKAVATDHVAALTFITKAPGTAQVSIQSANIDHMSNAPTKDTPAAVVQHDGVINITGTYKVNLDEGLTADETVASTGTDYIFKATDPSNYDYAPVATIDGTEIPVTDNGDGTYTIPGASITGEITVKANRTPKSYTVTVAGTGAADVTAVDNATYNTDYTFTVAKDSAYTYDVSAKIGDTDLTLTTGENGSYTIAGTAITGNITITVTKTVKPITSYPVTKPDYVSGADNAQKGEDYTFTITDEPGYNYGEPEVTVGGETVEATKNDDGSYTIPGGKITGEVVIKVDRSKALDVEVSQYLTLNGSVMWLATAKAELAEGETALYDGKAMFWSEDYGAYAWLVISDKSQEDVKTEAAKLVTAGNGTAVTIDYGGDVNMTSKVDVNDAQLVYDMYNAAYEDFDTVSMEKFLRADINLDKQVNTADTGKLINQLVG